MLALIISNDEEVTLRLENALKRSSYNVISYSWFLKALDNLMEINPDVIVINAEEYPRHWKLLAAYCSVLLKETNLFIYDTFPYSTEDIEICKNLGIKGLIKSTDIQDLGKFREHLKQYEDIDSKVQLVLYVQEQDSYISGKVLSMTEERLKFIPDGYVSKDIKNDYCFNNSIICINNVSQEVNVKLLGIITEKEDIILDLIIEGSK